MIRAYLSSETDIMALLFEQRLLRMCVQLKARAELETSLKNCYITVTSLEQLRRIDTLNNCYEGPKFLIIDYDPSCIEQ